MLRGCSFASRLDNHYLRPNVPNVGPPRQKPLCRENPMPSFSSRRSVPLFVCASIIGLVATACSGPRMLKLDNTSYPRRPSIYPIDIYIGDVGQPHRDIAVIESTAYAHDDEEGRRKQIEELKKEARRLGADAVQDVRILDKKVSGYTVDERVPIPAWKQGDYVLYFMRGKAVIYESSLPGAVQTGKGFASDATEKIVKSPAK